MNAYFAKSKVLLFSIAVGLVRHRNDLFVGLSSLAEEMGWSYHAKIADMHAARVLAMVISSSMPEAMARAIQPLKNAAPASLLYYDHLTPNQ